MAASLSRLSLYALISSIEEDFRDLLVTHLPHKGSKSSLLGKKLFEKLIERYSSELADPEETSLEEVLYYADYGDVLQLANSYKQSLPDQVLEQLTSLNPALEHLITIRNRVMHSRPLEFDDLARATEIASELLKNTGHWHSLRETKKRLTAEPEYLLRLHIPLESDNSRVSHNLPLPDFDETGFIGRKQTTNNLRKAIVGVYPAITIVGEGGLGKTSLALKVAYDLLDDPSCPFESIVFVSAKTHKLTEKEIERIKGAINNSMGLIDAAAKELGGPASKTLDDLIELMTQFRVLLIIDNLETVIDDTIKELLERLPEGSKILITTRIRFGAFEFPIQLEGLTSKEATQLLRATARMRDCGRLVETGDNRLAEYCRRMRNNPLHIKWFVSAVQAGQRPEAVLSDEKVFLQFCLSNVFSAVSEDGRKLVRTMLALGGSYTVAELSFLTEMDQPDLLSAIGELTRTNMFFSVSTPTEASYETKYELSQLARAYLSRFYPVGKEEQQRLLNHKKKLVSAGEQISSESSKNPLSANSIHCRNRSDWVTAKYLKEALGAIRAENIAEALSLIDKAKSLNPDFSEVYRVEAFAHVRSGNITSAYDCYEKALEFAPESAVTRMLFGGFLLREVQDSEAAIEQFEVAANAAPNQAEPKIELARACLYIRRFDDAERTIRALEKSNISNEYIRVKIADIHLQLLARRADFYATTHQPFLALEQLELLRAFWGKIENPDSKMRQRLSKVRGTAYYISTTIDSESKRLVAEGILAWIDSTTIESAAPQDKTRTLTLPTRGVIKSIHPTSKFGFIGQTGNEDIFFHITRVRPDHRPLLKAGTAVRFSLGIDWRGRVVAENVEVE